MPAKNEIPKGPTAAEKLQAKQNAERIYAVFTDSVYLIGVVIILSLSVFYFIFGFVNPDPKDCFYYPGIDVPERDPLLLQTTAISMNLKQLKGYPVNIAHIYRLWFIWGFFSLAGSLALLFLLKLGSDLLGKFKTAIMIFFAVTVALNVIAWLILGGIWRFSNSGKVVSGEKLEMT